MEDRNMRNTLVCVLALVICACSSNQTGEFNQSGVWFIGDYSKFEKVKTNDGLKSFRYASDNLRSGAYQKVIIEPVAFYPEEVVSAQITSALLGQTKAYIDEEFIDAIAQSFQVVESPQQGTFTLTPRITALKTTTGDIALREIIPIGAVVALGRAAAGQRHQNVEIFMEIKLTDSLTGEFIGGSVKQGKGQEISGSNQRVKIEDIKSILDTWVKDVKETFEKMSALTAD
ncbi:MAG: hypothetical protein ACJA09_000398 [Alcanivorax sp.]|jgi:hypothetical protein